jgi:predicted hydrocarbon binding protein
MNNLTKRILTSKNLNYTDDEMYMYKQPVVLVQTEFLVELTENAVETGTEDSIYNIGRKSVKGFARNVMKHNQMDHENMVKFLERLGTSTGWGNLELTDINEREGVEAVFTMEESIISKRTEIEGKVDYILSGMIAGALEEIYDSVFECEEVECKSDGDPECKFICKETS